MFGNNKRIKLSSTKYDALVECLKPWLDGEYQADLQLAQAKYQAEEDYAQAIHEQLDTVWTAHMTEHQIRVNTQDALARKDAVIERMRNENAELSFMVRVLTDKVKALRCEVNKLKQQ